MGNDSRDAWKVEMGRRLRQERIVAGLQAQDCAQRVGLSKQLWSHIEHGRTEPTTWALGMMRSTLKFDIDFILTGHRGSGVKHVSPEHHVPLLSPAQILAFAQKRLDIETLKKSVPALAPCSPKSFAFSVFDSAMEPRLRAGITTTGVDPEKAPAAGDCVLVVLLATKEVLFRRYEPGAGKLGEPPYILRADSAEWAAAERVVTKSDRPIIVAVKFQDVHHGST